MNENGGWRRMRRRVFRALLPKSSLLYRASLAYLNDYLGDNNVDIDENGESRFARRMLPHARTVFDVGANVGDWTALALTINSSLVIHAFEPSHATFSHLVSRRFPPNVLVNPIGLGEHSETRELFVYSDYSGANSLYRRVGTPSEQQKKEVVFVRTLDEYSKETGVERIEFLKIDVEGHEVFVLRGARQSLEAGRIGVIQFEYGGCYIDARALLRTFGTWLRPPMPDIRSSSSIATVFDPYPRTNRRSKRISTPTGPSFTAIGRNSSSDIS